MHENGTIAVHIYCGKLSAARATMAAAVGSADSKAIGIPGSSCSF